MHLQEKPMKAGTGVTFSSFTAGLRDARRATGRNQDTGHIVDELDGPQNWLGAIGYLILADHLGSCIRPFRSRQHPTGSDFEKFFTHFTQLKPRQITALWALRCILCPPVQPYEPGSGSGPETAGTANARF